MDRKIVLGNGYFHKYKSLKGENFLHVIEIIRTLSIYCPRPEELNDDEEFRPQFVLGDLSSSEYLKKIEQWVRRCLARRDPIPSESQIQGELKILNQIKLQEYADQLTTSYYKAVNARHRVISMTTSPLNEYVWNEYADQYAGVCFEFIIPKNFVPLYGVDYVQEPKKLDLAGEDEFEQLMITALTKDAKWKDEKEYRLVLSDPPIEGGPSLRKGMLHLMPGMISSIYFGFRMDPVNERRLIKELNKRLPEVKKYRVYSGIPYKEVFSLRIKS